jgi:hypothetical protein
MLESSDFLAVFHYPHSYLGMTIEFAKIETETGLSSSIRLGAVRRNSFVKEEGAEVRELEGRMATILLALSVVVRQVGLALKKSWK